MNKKLFIGLMALVLVFGIGATAYVGYAQINGSPNNGFYGMGGMMGDDFDYEQMQNFMTEQGLSYDEMIQYMEEQGIDVEQMYSSCHGTSEINGGVQAQSMMNF